MPVTTHIDGDVWENTTAVLAGTFQNESGSTITNLSTLTMTIRDALTGQVINFRSQTDILSDQTSGVLSRVLTQADNQILHQDLPRERHEILLEFTFPTSRAGTHRVTYDVINAHGVSS